MQERRSIPDVDRLSVLTATILLAYALTRFVNIPERAISIRLPGIFLVFSLNFQTIVAVLVAVLAATGMDWLLHDHPALAGRSRSGMLHHWLLPSLTALVIGLPLSTLAAGVEWWILFGMGGGLLLLVFIAEYVVVDPADILHPHAAAGLTALSFALFLILSVAVREAGLRLYLALPALMFAAGLVSLRTLYLRCGRWMFAWAIGIAGLVGNLASGLHYWRIAPIPFGLVLLGPAYALTMLAASYQRGRPVRGWLIEPAALLIVIWGLAVILA
ncbi:MAG TPA: hypothetical protein VF813_01880 [Anaerolineaceae bacterium]